jgi:hypothetical protein
MPSATGVVQEAGVPRRPSISTRHSRQEPKASTLSVAQSFGTCDAGLGGGAHDGGAFGHGHVDAVDGERDGRTGLRGRAHVAVIGGNDEIPHDLLFPLPSSFQKYASEKLQFFVRETADFPPGLEKRLIPPPPRREFLGELGQRAHHRIGREAAQRAERAILHRLAEIDQQLRRRPVARRDPVERLDAPHRADPAGRAFPAALDGAELHREAREPSMSAVSSKTTTPAWPISPPAPSNSS